MANKAKTENKFWIVDRLNEIKVGKVTVSYHLLRTLEEKGFIKPTFVKVVPGRGRGRKVYELAGKGNGYLALSSKWKRTA